MTATSCRRVSCSALATLEHCPWCSQVCERIGRSVEALPLAPAASPHMVTADAAVGYAWPWLDARAADDDREEAAR